MDHFDAIIVGTGQAGPSLAHRLAAAGRKVCIIERNRFGGTCVNTGCTPTKALVASAYVLHQSRRAADYGLSVSGKIEADWPAIQARALAIAAKSSHGVKEGLRTLENCTVINGHARFTAAHQMQVGDRHLSAPQIFINVGGRAIIPDQIDSIQWLTNSSLLNLKTLPRHLTIVGGSYIALEFGQMFQRFGSEVTILERGPRLASHEDEDVSHAIHEILTAEGVTVHLNAPISDLKRIANGSPVLFATGRRPNTDDLDLQKAGITVDAKGFVPVDDQLRTPVEGIWALGDCNGRGAFTHTSYNDFEIVAANLLDGEPRSVASRIPAYAVYMDPPLARVGMTEAEVRASGRSALVASKPMSQVARAIEKGETKGFMKILVDAADHKILGAAILGTGGDEAIHCVLDTMYAGAPYTVMTHAVHIHPTVSELIPTMLGTLKPLEKS